MQQGQSVIRAGISGTNWTGKSSMIQSFVERRASLKIDRVVLSDLVRRCPHPTVEDQTPEASRWMLERMITILSCPPEADLQLFDRSPVDILSFTQYAFDREKKDADTELLSAIYDTLDRFDVVFYLPLSEDWPVGVSPSTKEIAFALLMDRYIRQTIRRYQIAVVELPWNASERQRLVDIHFTS